MHKVKQVQMVVQLLQLLYPPFQGVRDSRDLLFTITAITKLDFMDGINIFHQYRCAKKIHKNNSFRHIISTSSSVHNKQFISESTIVKMLGEAVDGSRRSMLQVALRFKIKILF